MSYCTVSHWTTTAWTDEMEALAREKYVPLVMAVGASSVQMLRTDENAFSVVTQYVDEATAISAQEKIAAIRAEATEELPMTMQNKTGGVVFASG
ncbi:hypothetical protein CEP88_19965 [Roseobacter denitrificans]|uniref:ABM domain-containing protein n=1 Tax=Roseobacter denitrificans (strain ATCC 33942 / OCh 114) TaxID=375451 RepID=Q168D6_ROSDO|nr:hypothetical protein [Roseobacter denitrificans]ABG31657.1 hypothetical protein RD1_2055 [Roseobacter denitrificans OCh 114]AVL54634.1 hypothetical protein CEP88_19965 [Roseobacter denitrificans]SFF88722.1 hypothetical protein SAMN05443635_103173 [Roseobacter denitrificans OCh 114]